MFEHFLRVYATFSYNIRFAILIILLIAFTGIVILHILIDRIALENNNACSLTALLFNLLIMCLFHSSALFFQQITAMCVVVVTQPLVFYFVNIIA